MNGCMGKETFFADEMSGLRGKCSRPLNLEPRVYAAQIKETKKENRYPKRFGSLAPENFSICAFVAKTRLQTSDCSGEKPSTAGDAKARPTPPGVPASIWLRTAAQRLSSTLTMSTRTVEASATCFAHRHGRCA